jgi:hypothetical protein
MTEKRSHFVRLPSVVAVVLTFAVVASNVFFLNKTETLVVPNREVSQLSVKQQQPTAAAAATITVEDAPIVATSPTVFFCATASRHAFGEARAIFESVLPEYQWVKINIKKGFQQMEMNNKVRKLGINNEWDFFLTPLIGKLCGCTDQELRWIMDEFRGNGIYVSGESIGDYLPANMNNKYVIGPTSVESDRTMTLTYLQMTWWQVFRPMYGGDSVLLDPARRPRGLQPNADKDFLVYAASNCIGFRETAFRQLSEIAPAHFGGKCNGGGGDAETPMTNRTFAKSGVTLNNWKDNVGFYSKYRFCLVMEHINEESYMTEKILMAFLGGCIPIYYGSKAIHDVFNPEAFVYYDIHRPKAALDLVRRLEENPVAYDAMLRKPLLYSDDTIDARGTLAKYFGFSESVAGGGVLKANIRSKLGLDRYDFSETTTTTNRKQPDSTATDSAPTGVKPQMQ